MVSNDLGACEWFVWDLRRSGLIDRGQLDQIVNEFLKKNPRGDAPALAEFLVDQQTLTSFQAERILNSKTQGLVLGPYVLEDAVGQGSMGQVYRAISKNDSGQYAVKVLPRRSMWNVRLARRQVRSFGQFSHPAVVPFVDVGTAGGLHYLTWPFVQGRTLDTLLQQHGKLGAEQTALIGMQVAQGLNVCHQNNIFHGLIKPSNILVGDDNQTRILDFGIGSLLVENEGESLVDTMSTANTLTSGLDCCSPESIVDPTNRTPAGDQYSLGCTLYHALTGRVPFPEGSAVEKMMAHQTETPESIKEFAPNAPDGLVQIIERLMAKNPDDRYHGTDEVAEALEPFVGNMNVQPASGERRGLGSKFGSSRQMQTLPKRSNVDAAAETASTAHDTPPPQPAQRKFDRPASPSAPPKKMPGRSSFQKPRDEADVELSAADLPLQQPPMHGDPAALRASAGWVQDAADADRQRSGSGNSNLGTVAVVAVAILMMVLVFIGAKLLMS